MLTETEARELLAKAAETIDVPPGTPIDAATRRPRWVVASLAAAAVVAVVAVVAGGMVLLGDHSSKSAPDPSAPSPTPRTSSDLNPTPGRIPSVFAYDADSAGRMLAAAGLDVTVERKQRCDATGRALRTEPSTGTPFRRGDPVTLVVTDPSWFYCVPSPNRALAWSLLDFANDRAPAPAFASEVRVFVNGEETTLTDEQAADPASWSDDSSALGLLAAATRQVAYTYDPPRTPELGVEQDSGTQFACGSSRPPGDLASRPSVWIDLSFPADGIVASCTNAHVYQTDGRIDAIDVDSFGHLYPATPEQNQEPAPDPDPDGVGAAFLAFARGERDSLPVNTPVRLYLGNAYEKTISAADTQDPSAWNVCAAYAERSCPMSGVATLRDFPAQPVITDVLPRSACLDEWGHRPDTPTDTGGTHLVVLGPAEPQSCGENFAVEIWSNDVGQITAVNLLFGSP